MSKHPLYNQTGFQKDNKSHVLYALANKQMELKLIQDEYEVKISKIKTDLQALETTICLFDCDCSETIKKINKKNSKPKQSSSSRNSYFAAGEAKSVILRILREANRVVPTEYITKKAIEIQKINTDVEGVLQNVAKTINNVLRRIEKENIIINDTTQSGNSRMLYWKIRD